MDTSAQSLQSKRSYKEEIIPFKAGDGMQLNLIHVLGDQPTPKGPVLLVHGAGVRANIFRAPVDCTLVDTLLEHGYDVWLENWRASIDFEPNQWTLDQAALYDHPYAVQKIVDETGYDQIKAVIHCQGSTSFTIAAISGLIPQVKTIVSNAVSLHPVVPKLAGVKLKYIAPLVKLFTPYINPQWGIQAPNMFAKLTLWFVLLTHRECDNNVCRLASFTYGAGFPTLWLHENFNDRTHEWLKNEFKQVPITFFNQIRKSVEAGHLVREENLSELAENYISFPPKTTARFAFIAGEQNHCFLPESQRLTYEYMSGFKSNYHTLNIIPNYGHLDIFMGKNACQDVFPTILRELDS